MTTATTSAEFAQHQPQAATRAPGSLATDWIAALLGVWAIGGTYLDGWAHNHGLADTSFFTPWHAALYTGVLAIFTFLAFLQRRGRQQGYSFLNALPKGYPLSVAGAALFLIGGFLDGVWHTLYGIEVSTEALLSPTHLLLAVSAILMITGPVRSAFARLTGHRRVRWAEIGPLVISMILVWGVFTFFTGFGHPLNNDFPANGWIAPAASAGPARQPYLWTNEGAGLSSILLQSALMVGVLLAATLGKDWRLPFGAYTLLIGINGLGMTLFQDKFQYVPPAFIAGLLIDLLAQAAPPGIRRPVATGVFGFAAPAIYCALYFITVAATGGIGWSIHLWAGAIFMAGATGLLVALAMSLPAQRQAAH